VKKVTVCLLSGFLMAGASCGNKNNLYPVSGRVTFQGAPAAGAVVFFRRQGADLVNEHMIMGIVQDDGTFELVCGSLGKGAPPGEYNVLIEWKRITGQSKGRPRRSRDELNGRYADPQHPLLHATIEARPTSLSPFELTDPGPGQRD
jgi:hypothetical protein